LEFPTVRAANSLVVDQALRGPEQLRSTHGSRIGDSRQKWCVLTHAPSADTDRCERTAGPRQRRRWMSGDRGAPIVVSIVFFGLAWAYMLEWAPLVRHKQYWITPVDIWGTYQAAHLVGWGWIGGIYGRGSDLITYPGIAVVLAPVAMLTSALHLVDSANPIFLSHPTSWLFLGNADLLLGVTTIFSANRMVAQLGVGRRRRAVLCWMVAVVIWPVIVMWGHPEDCLALSLAMFALVAVEKGKWNGSGWLWGAAISVQPLVLLMFPVALSRVTAGRRLRVCVRAVIPTVALLAIPVVTNWGPTSDALLRQPNFPFIDHPTPWMALAPRLTATSVAAGPGRLIAFAVAFAVGVVAFRVEPDFGTLVWACAFALCMRCVFESVMVPFYLGPPLVMCLVAASARRRGWRLALTFAASLAVSVVSMRRMGEWSYWLAMTVLLGVALAGGWPGVAWIRVGSQAATGRVDDDLELAPVVPETDVG